MIGSSPKNGHKFNRTVTMPLQLLFRSCRFFRFDHTPRLARNLTPKQRMVASFDAYGCSQT
jgi:hypothetical protein